MERCAMSVYGLEVVGGVRKIASMKGGIMT